MNGFNGYIRVKPKKIDQPPPRQPVPPPAVHLIAIIVQPGAEFFPPRLVLEQAAVRRVCRSTDALPGFPIRMLGGIPVAPMGDARFQEIGEAPFGEAGEPGTPQRENRGENPAGAAPAAPAASAATPAAAASPAASVPPGLRALHGGKVYRITSEPRRNLVTPALAEVLEQLFESFAAVNGFTTENPLAIGLSRGYAQGDRGHGRGLAADIAMVGGRSLAEWKRLMDETISQASRIPDPQQRAEFFRIPAGLNLGLGLYKALLAYGGWRVYNQVVQLFGPWTDVLGPWKKAVFENPTEAHKRLLDAQEHIYRAHQDHIHVAVG